MGSDAKHSQVTDLPSIISTQVGDLIATAQRINAAVMLLGPADEILFANDRQRTMMPCIDYADSSYADLFWAGFAAGTIGNAAARLRPQEWLDFSTFERHRARVLQSVNEYPWGCMAVTHRRLDDGNYLQMRFAIDPEAIDIMPETTLLAAARAAGEARALRHALDAVQIGVGILDVAGHVLFANASLTQDLARGDVMAAPAGQVVARHEAVPGAWRTAIATSAMDAATITMTLRRADGAAAIVAGLIPGEHTGTTILLTSPLRREFGDALHEGLVAAFALTRAEAEVMARMALGQRPQEIAEARSGAVGTTYQQVASAKRKLRALDLAPSSQADLVSAVLAVAASTRAPRRSLNQVEVSHDDDDR